MVQTTQKLVSPVSLMIDAVLVIAFFLFLFFILVPHVPSTNPASITAWAALTSACMSGVFWLALQMFRVVYRFQKTGGA